MRGMVRQGLRGPAPAETTADSQGPAGMKDSTHQQHAARRLRVLVTSTTLAVRTEIARALRLHDAADRRAAHAAGLAFAVVDARLLLELPTHAVRVAEVA